MATEQRSAFPGAVPQSFTLRNSSRFEVLPYVQLEDGWTVPADDVLRIYDSCEREGLARLVFFDGSIDSRAKFLETAQAPTNLVVFLAYEGEKCGFAWLNAFGRRSAFAHFCVLKAAWGEPARVLGDKVLEYWMSFTRNTGEPLFELILGTIPCVNRRAIRFVKDIGFESCGMIPKLVEGRDGRLHPGEIVYFLRD